MSPSASVVLNELSCAECETLSTPQISVLVEVFADNLAALQRLRPSFGLSAIGGVLAVEVAPGVTLARFAPMLSTQHKWRQILAAANRAAVQDAGELVDGGLEFEFQASPCTGLGVAHLVDGMGISLGSAVRWNAAHLEILERLLVENDDGTTEIVERPVTVRHMANGGHLPSHAEWFVQWGGSRVGSGAELWTVREELFPHLTFLPRVEGDLEALLGVELGAVIVRLADLELAVALWEGPARTSEPSWRSRVSPESRSRRPLTVFPDRAGVDREYSLHARYTPGAGRIHFRVDGGQGVCEIAYVGRKLGA